MKDLKEKAIELVKEHYQAIVTNDVGIIEYKEAKSKKTIGFRKSCNHAIITVSHMEASETSRYDSNDLEILKQEIINLRNKK